VLFQRGAFGPDDTANTALALAVYGLGLPAFVAQKVLQPLFYAREDTRTPFRYALVSLVVNAALAIGLMPFIGFIAAAIGTTLSAWAMVALLWAGSRRMGDAARLDSRSRRRLWRIAVSATVMGIALFGGELLLGPALGMPALRYAALLALVAGGAAVFFGTGFAIGAFRVEDFRTALRRQR
jgi:putative peptidoglycan lipid II flippase